MDSMLTRWWRLLRRARKQSRELRKSHRRDQKYRRKAQIFSAAEPLSITIAAGSDAMAFSHAGNAGDIIYSLPSLRLIAGSRSARLLLETGTPAFYATGIHPAGQVRLNQKIASCLLPLLNEQIYLNDCKVKEPSDIVHCRLDRYRDAPIPGDRGHIGRSCAHVFALELSLADPWLGVTPDRTYADWIIVARSQRYRNSALNYRFLGNFKRVAFVGTDEEFVELREQLPRLERIATPDFLVMAHAIAGARLFIGNQSLPFAIAEALKVPRVLEVYPFAPNVLPEGGRFGEAWFQPQFERFVETLFTVADAQTLGR